MGLALFACVASAQEPVRSNVLIIDSERLFAESTTGQALTAEVERQGAVLTEENRRIQAELIAEEQALTNRRTEVTPEEFRSLADAFDTKVQRMRAEQDTKARALIQRRDEGRQRFLQDSIPILARIIAERGAFVLLNKADVFLSAETIDITDEAIRRLDARFSPGVEVPPEPEQGVTPQPAPVPAPETPGE